jgi:hypothetical protein
MKSNSKNISELAFEDYLKAHDLTDWDLEPVIQGKAQRPDYCLRFRNRKLFFEVKEFRQDVSTPLPSGGAYDPHTAIREKINAAREKFQHFKEHSCSLVLYNVDAWLVHLDDFMIMMGSMLGDLGLTFTVDKETATKVGEPTWSFLRRGKMINYKRMQPQNTTVNALVAITTLSVGQRRFETELDRKEHDLGRALQPEEFMRFAESVRARGLDIGHSVTRAIVYENPYARIPLTRDIFVGDYDERFGPEGDRIVRVFAGPEIENLEATERIDIPPT